MAFSLYDISIPYFIRYLGNVSELLEKGERYADEQGIAHSKLLEARLAPDMEPFLFQVRLSTNFAKGPAINLGGVDPIDFPNDESTFEQLRRRVQKTLEILHKVDKAKMEGGGETEVTVKNRLGEFSFKGNEYILTYSVPTFFFHVSMTYGILRHCGVPIGKADYVGLK